MFQHCGKGSWSRFKMLLDWFNGNVLNVFTLAKKVMLFVTLSKNILGYRFSVQYAILPIQGLISWKYTWNNTMVYRNLRNAIWLIHFQINKYFILLAVEAMLVRLEVAGLCQWQCTECLYVSKKSHVVRHIEQKHVGLQYPCAYCQSIYTRKDALKVHMKLKHGFENL